MKTYAGYINLKANTYGSNNIVLISLLKEKSIKGVVMLSVFSLPNNFNDRKNIYKICLDNKKEIHFNFEQLRFYPP